MLIFNKEKHDKDLKELKIELNGGFGWTTKCDGKEAKYEEISGKYKVGEYEVYPEWCIDTEEKGETMKELLERWKKTKDADLLKACEIIEEQLDTADKYMDLLEEHESLQEEFEDYKKDVDENYEQKPFNPYEEYGVNESDFH